MSIVKLNVGGVRYQTTTATLNRFPDSMLARMIQQKNEAQIIEEGREIFIDRDGKLFGYILDYFAQRQYSDIFRRSYHERNDASRSRFLSIIQFNRLDQARKRF